MMIPRLFLVLAIASCCYHYGMADENKPMIRGSAAGRVDEAGETSTKAKPTASRGEENVMQVEKRLLWRNETPFDDDSYATGEKDRQSHENTLDHGIQPGLIAITLENSDPEESNPTESEGGNGVVDTPVDADGDSIFEVENEYDDDEFSNSTDIYNPAMNNNETEVPTSSTSTIVLDPVEEKMIIETSHNENVKQDDCLWRILTGTSCTPSMDIVNGYQHEYVIADGECQYNDFLGYYRAGCQKQIGDGDLAKVVLKDVFCTDPECSTGCQKDSVIRPNSVYTSELCYVSAFYDQRKNDDGVKAEFRVANDPQTRKHDFSFEFVGGCLESENCLNVVIE